MKEKDAESFLKLRIASEIESKGMVFEAGERKTTIEEVKRAVSTFSKDSTIGIFGIRKDGDLAAFLIINGMSAVRVRKSRTIAAMAVLKKYWGQGMGKALLDFSKDFAKKKKIHYLGLEVWADNKRAIKMYKEAGFKIEGRRKEYAFIDGKFIDWIIMGMIIK